MPDQVIRHWEDFGTANTPTAPSGIRIDVVVEGVRRGDGITEMHVALTTTNFAMLDNAVGAVKVGIMMDGETIAQYVVQSDRNPGRGFSAPTVRQGFRSEVLPTGLTFNRIGLVFANLDNADNITIDWQKVIEIGATILTTTLAFI